MLQVSQGRGHESSELKLWSLERAQAPASLCQVSELPVHSNTISALILAEDARVAGSYDRELSSVAREL